MIKVLDGKKLKDLEGYAALLLTSMLSLKSLIRYQTDAFSTGLLKEDEAHVATTICWEMNKLLTIYKTQVDNILERTNINEEELIKSIQALAPDLKMTKSRKKKGEE